jgi:hypothetical protein
MENCLLRLSWSEEWVVVTRKDLFDFSIVADSGASQIGFLLGLTVGWRFTRRIGRVERNGIGRAAAFLRNVKAHDAHSFGPAKRNL